jgi:hypothetical protein
MRSKHPEVSCSDFQVFPNTVFKAKREIQSAQLRVHWNAMNNCNKPIWQGGRTYCSILLHERAFMVSARTRFGLTKVDAFRAKGVLVVYIVLLYRAFLS